MDGWFDWYVSDIDMILSCVFPMIFIYNINLVYITISYLGLWNFIFFGLQEVPACDEQDDPLAAVAASYKAWQSVCCMLLLYLWSWSMVLSPMSRWVYDVSYDSPVSCILYQPVLYLHQYHPVSESVCMSHPIVGSHLKTVQYSIA